MLRWLGYVLLFAVASALLYAWGLLKSRREPQQLSLMLVRKCKRMIHRALKQNRMLTLRQITALIEKTTVSLFYSRRRFGITDPEAFAEQLLRRMQDDGELSFDACRNTVSKNQPCFPNHA